MDTRENRSVQTMNEFNQILEDYEELFGELPPIPKGGSFSTIADLMQDALISRRPVSVDDILDAFKDVVADLGEN